jgi:hypothetical protein
MTTLTRFTFSDRLPDLTSLIAVFGPLLFGGSLTAQPVDRYSLPLDREAPRGVQTVRYSVPNGRPDEISVLPRHLAFAKYQGEDGADDTAEEKKLGHYDFYKPGNTPDDGAVALCPKNKSTSAAVELFEIPKGSSKPEEETASYCTSIRKTSKDLAKFKQTDNAFTTTNTAAILGYYHVSRALGNICEIQPAILRTMDIEQHKKVVKMAADLGIGGTVRKSWNLFNKYYANPKASSVAATLFTNDFQQIYGALLKNTRGEEPYAEWLRAGNNLGSVQAFRNMADSRPAAAILGSSQFTPKNVQVLVGMRDMSELILLDYLLAQSDRLTGGNISDFNVVYYLQDNQVKHSRKADNVPPGATQVSVKKLTIVDTDAGLVNQNVFDQKGYLNQICHLHPDTYNRLLDFAQRWKTDPEVKAFFHQECTFSNGQLARFEKDLLTAAAIMQNRRNAGKLLLDLDLDEFFKSAHSQ